MSPLGNYRRYFGTRVEMNMAFTALFLAEADLATPIPDNAATLFELADAFIDHEYSMTTPLSAQVRSILMRNLALGRATKKDVARQLNMHAKTLERKLNTESSGFRALLEEVRREAAYRFLRESTLPISQIAAMIGFREPAVLTRSCPRWFGRSPTELRHASDRPRVEPMSQLVATDLAARVKGLERENARLRRLVDRLA